MKKLGWQPQAAAWVLGLVLSGCGGGSGAPAARNMAPIALASVVQAAVAGTTVTLDGSGSTDGDGDALTFDPWYASVIRWNADGTTTNLSQATIPPWPGFTYFTHPMARGGYVVWASAFTAYKEADDTFQLLPIVGGTAVNFEDFDEVT